MIKPYYKSVLVSVACVVFANAVTAQDVIKDNSTLYTIAGLASFPDMDRHENEFVLGLGYRRRLNNTFSAELFFQRSSADSTLPFFENKEVLGTYLNENNIVVLLDFSKVSTNALGAKLHFTFLDKGRHFFSFALGYGLFWSKSTVQWFKEFTYNKNGEISDFEVSVNSEDRNKSFIMPGLLYTVNLYKNFGLGLELSAFFEQGSEGVITTPLLQPNYYSASLIIFKSF